MALADLSPWPTDGLTAARACLRAALGGREASEDGGTPADPTDDVIDRYGATAAAMVEAFAPEAVQPIKNEATIRVAGWLKGARSDDLIQLGTFGINLQYRHNPSRNALRLSGAAGLLAPWRSPSASVLEEAD